MQKDNNSYTFGEISLSRKVFNAVRAMGFEEPSPIQAQTIPLLLNGFDVIGQAQTGTGKTAAFGIPAIEKVNVLSKRLQVLVLTPTRELAVQVAEEFNKIGHFKKVKTLPIYGGQSIDRQIRALKYGVQIVVGTPGRLLDHVNRGTIRLEKIETLILDEADEMLDMGFIDDINSIMKAMPDRERQTLLFSATMPEPIMELAGQYMHEPQIIRVSQENITVPLIDQYYYEMRDKLDGLCRILDVEETGKLIIFCRTKKCVDDLTTALEERGYLAGGLHGDLSQQQRDRVMKKFREGVSDILIATDVAARGIDIDDITHVINFDIPQDSESYVHRIGRTGRAGRRGMAITLIQPREYRQLRLISRLTRSKIIRRDVPSYTDVIERQREVVKNNLLQVLSADNFHDYQQIVKAVTEEGNYSVDEVAAAALKLSIEGVSDNNVQLEKMFADTGGEPGMVRLFLNIGRNKHLHPEDVVRSIASMAEIPGNAIGVINIYDKFTFVEVPENMAVKVLETMQNCTIRGCRINIEPAKRSNR